MKIPVLQRGVAAIELAFICMVMVAMLLGMMAWWNYFQAHQIITRAVGDGVRMAQSLVAIQAKQPCGAAGMANLHRSEIQQRVDLVVRQSLALSGLAGQILEPIQFQWTCPAGLIAGTLNVRVVWPASPVHIRESGVLHFQQVN